MSTTKTPRRQFLRTAALFSFAPVMSLPEQPQLFSQPEPINRNVFGPRQGFTPMMSNLVSMMDWMRNTLLSSVRGLSKKELDFIIDDDANSIGAMLLHLVATERFYQLNSFDGRSWGDWPKADADKYNVAMGLGDAGRESIKGNKISYYLDELEQVRAVTLAEFAKRDDEWLLATDENFAWGPTNNYCKWFHVCEHESNHNGQIKFLQKRVV